MSTMELGQLFTQINHLIQVDAPDWTATGFYVVDPSHTRIASQQGNPKSSSYCLSHIDLDI